MKREYIVTQRQEVEALHRPSVFDSEAPEWVVCVTSHGYRVFHGRTATEHEAAEIGLKVLRAQGTVRPADQPDPIVAALYDLVEKAEAVHGFRRTQDEIDLEYDLKESIQRAKEVLRETP